MPQLFMVATVHMYEWLVLLMSVLPFQSNMSCSAAGQSSGLSYHHGNFCMLTEMTASLGSLFISLRVYLLTVHWIRPVLYCGGSQFLLNNPGVTELRMVAIVAYTYLSCIIPNSLHSTMKMSLYEKKDLFYWIQKGFVVLESMFFFSTFHYVAMSVRKNRNQILHCDVKANICLTVTAGISKISITGNYMRALTSVKPMVLY